MSYIDSKYIGIISFRLEKFSKKKEGLYNFRCPYCGDSQRSKNKTRGYLYRAKSDLNYKCHNCGVTRSFAYFIKDLDESLYKEYSLERYKEGLTGKSTTVPDPKFTFDKPKFNSISESEHFKDLIKVSDLNTTHPAKQYLINRKISEKHLYKFYFTEDYNSWSKNKNGFKESRIIIPLISKDNKVFGYQGRSLEKNSKLRYITTILDSEYPKIFGLNTIDETKSVYVTEGPFDSLFVENSIAMCGADVDLSGFNYDFVYIFDNEPRNKEICGRMQRIINSNQKIVIWPKTIEEKDINDMVISGYTPQEIISNNTFRGLEAKLKFADWKKV